MMEKNQTIIPTVPPQKPQKTTEKISPFARISFWFCILGIVYFLICIKFDDFISEEVAFEGLLIAEAIALIFTIIGFFQLLFSKSMLSGVLYCVFVITTLLILAIVIPNFLRFAVRAKQSEAKQNLEAIYAAYQAYHNNYHTYPSSPFTQKGETSFDCFKIAGWQPKETWIRYNYNCMNTEVFSPANSNYPCPSGIVTTATKDSFTIAACGNVDNDATVDVWTINDAKHLRNVVDDVKK